MQKNKQLPESEFQIGDIEISRFKDCKATSSTAISIDSLFSLIKTGEGYKLIIEKIRTASDPAEKDNLKKQLPAVTVSGLFDKARKKEHLTAYSGLMQIDLDKLENLTEIRAKLEKDKYSFGVFLSPSGNGLKIIVKILNDFKKHLEYFLALEKYFFETYNLQIDKSCKDVTRLMFLSWDENVFINKNAIVFCLEKTFEEKQFEKTYKRFIKKETFTEGNRNAFLFKLACLCSEAGISQVFTEKRCLELFLKNDFPETEIKTTVKSAFKKVLSVPKNEDENKNAKSEKKLLKFNQVESFLNSNYEFRNNIVSAKIEFRQKNNENVFKELNENNVYCDLSRNNLEISISKLMALINSEFVPVFNPFTNYFENLKTWNAKTEIDFIEKLCLYIPVKDVGRFKKHFKKMFVRCIACALQDSVFNKQALIFVHDQQGSGKTSLCRWLCPPVLADYIAENINTDKDSQIALATNLLINMDELATLSKMEINALKSLISRDKINLRLPFDRRATVRPRRATFIGSTNKDEFLTDETGSVRWLCFELTGKINFAYKDDIDINDIWRQAYTLYCENLQYQLTQDEIEENEQSNKQFIVTSPEMDLIKKSFAQGTKERHDFFYTATDILTEISKSNLFVTCKSHAIGKALKFLGFPRSQQYNESTKMSGYGYYVRNIQS